MESDRLDRLTEQQRICLRHVYAHLTSKEIAPLMGIEPNTVDQHIKAAMRVLDAPDRRAAARMLAEHESRLAARPLVYQSPDVASAPVPVTFVPSRGSGRHSGISGQAIREEQAVFMTASRPFGSALPFPIGGARPNDVGWLTKLAWIAGIAIGIALAFGALVAGVEALTRLLWG